MHILIYRQVSISDPSTLGDSKCVESLDVRLSHLGSQGVRHQIASASGYITSIKTTGSAPRSEVCGGKRPRRVSAYLHSRFVSAYNHSQVWVTSASETVPFCTLRENSCNAGIRGAQSLRSARSMIAFT